MKGADMVDGVAPSLDGVELILKVLIDRDKRIISSRNILILCFRRIFTLM